MVLEHALQLGDAPCDALKGSIEDGVVASPGIANGATPDGERIEIAEDGHHAAWLTKARVENPGLIRCHHDDQLSGDERGLRQEVGAMLPPTPVHDELLPPPRRSAADGRARRNQPSWR